MADSITKPIPQGANTQRLAWGVLLVSFAVFCVIMAFVIVGIQYFLFQSRIPMKSEVQVSRGTATLIGTDLIEQAVHNQREITSTAVLTTDPQSQASLLFTDPQDDSKLIATITEKSGSSLNLTQDSRPRFEWSTGQYWIDFDDAYGEFEVFIPDNLERPILIGFNTTLGPSVRLTSGGRYSIVAAGSQVQVENYSGQALLIPPDLHSQPIPAGQRASMEGDGSQFTVEPGLINLLGDATFSANNVLDYNATADQVRPQVWRCNSVQPSGQPAGTFGLVTADGRPALHLFRDEGAESHGATSCVQGLGTGSEGLDVSNATHISIQTTFKIQSQSLSTCGVDGSECPLMLQMDYLPVNPQNPLQPGATWHHGFYAFVDSSRFFPLMCDTCSEQHEQINPGVWYTYESRNFLDAFAQDQRPKSILNLRVYASGHQYDVYVSEIELLVDQTKPAETAASSN